jgi:hypothetical protein
MLWGQWWWWKDNGWCWGQHDGDGGMPKIKNMGDMGTSRRKKVIEEMLKDIK